LSLGVSQAAAIVDAKTRESRVEIDFTTFDVDSIEHGQDTLSNRRYIADGIRVTVLEDDSTADDGNESS